MFQAGSLGDRDTYPTFPSFPFTGYPDSVFWETYCLIVTITENDFYTDQSSALRYLLMHI